MEMSKSQFYLSFCRSNLMLCEKVAADTDQTSFSANRSHGPMENVKIAILPQIFTDQISFRAKRLPRKMLNGNFTSAFVDRTSFRAKGLPRRMLNRNLTSVFANRTSFRAKWLLLWILLVPPPGLKREEKKDVRERKRRRRVQL